MRVLVPLDGSPEAESILAFLAPMARLLSLELTLFRALETERPTPRDKAYLEAAREGLAKKGVAARFEVGAGRAAEEIGRFARARRFDLVAMTTHGRSGLSRLLVGSVTEEVLLRVRTPILVTRPGLRPRGWNNLLAAFGDSAGGEDLLRDVLPLARSMNAVVHMLQALRSSSVRAAAGGLSDRARQAGIRAVAASRGGDAEDSILAYAEEIATTFICLPGSDGGLGAKVAKGVMRHASCPVLVGSTAPAPVSRCS